MNLTSLRKVIPAALGLLSLVPAAGASTLYATDYTPGSVSYFYTVNTSTGALTRVGSTGVNDIGDLTSNQVYTIWGVQLTTDDLLTINPFTGVAAVGPALTGTGLSTNNPIASLAWDPATGVLYGNSSTGYGATADTLYSINPTTGAATLIGKIGFSDIYALGFGQDGTLYGIEDSDALGTVLSINLTTGAGTSTGNTDLQGIFDLASDPAGSGFFAADGNNFSLYKVNVANGTPTQIGSYQSDANIAGLAFLAPATAAPEAASIVMLTAGLGLIGLASLRKKKP
jgi:hypothetical protein